MRERVWAPELQGVERFWRHYETENASNVSEFMAVAGVAGNDPRLLGTEIIHKALVDVIHQCLRRCNIYR